MILVTGADGFVGRKLVSALAKAGWPVRAYVPPRRQGRVQRAEWPDSVQIVVGDLDDHARLHEACQGAHTIFHLASAQWWGRGRDLEAVDLQSTRNIIAAARSARVGRLVYLSQLGAEPSSAYDLLRIKGQAESLVRNSGIAYTILRVGVLFGPEDRFFNAVAMLLRTNPLIVLQPGEGENLLHPLFVDDLVQALLNSLERIDLVDAIIEVGGAEYVSFNEALRTIMRVSGSRRIIMSLPPYVVRAISGVASRFTRRWPVTTQWFDILAGNRTAKLGNLYDYCGVRPVRFEDTLLTYMPQRRYGLELMRYIWLRRRPW